MLDRLDQARDTGYRGLQFADAEYRRRFDPADIRPTRLSNSRAAYERYPHLAYSVDFDFLWPRLRMVFPKDKAISDAVETASAQLDFAILMTALSVPTVAGWVFVLACFGTSPTLFLLVGLLGPALVLFFYRLIQETQAAFGEVMIMAVDGLRLELLRSLHQPLPSSLAVEQALWETLQLALYSGLLSENVQFRHPKT